MKLSEFIPQKEENTKSMQENSEKMQKNTQNIEEIYNNYKNFNSEQLTEELYKNIAKQKCDGTFDYEKIQSLIQNVMPYLGEEQKNNLLSIMQKIK